MSDGPLFFASGQELRAWFVDNHATETEVLVGFWKVGTGRPSITWSESVDEALCFGWIDGVRRRIDDLAYSIRFTPRRPGSVWSSVNLAKVEVLTAAGRMTPAGELAHSTRTARDPQYSFEQKVDPELNPAQEKEFRANATARAFFERQAPSYRKRVIWWIVSAKREQTRTQRLGRLIDACEQGRLL